MPENWRMLPFLYAGMLVVMAVAFWFLTIDRKPMGSGSIQVSQAFTPLKEMRVWRFGAYYFFVFGGFVGLCSWLVPYYVQSFGLSLRTAGVLGATFALGSGVIRAFGGWLSDRFGARRVLYGVFGGGAVGCGGLIFATNLYLFSFLVFCVGILMGLGMAAVFKHVANYYPNAVGVVGGVGVGV